MPPQPFVRGPGHIFARREADPIVYLGTAENTPRIEIRPAHTPYFNSVFSAKVPMDWNDQGEEAFVIADMNRWDEAVYQAMASRPNPQGVIGFQAAGEIGSMVIFEGYAFELWVQFPYSAKPAMNKQPGGYHFYNVRLVGPDAHEPISMEPAKTRFIWHALPDVTPTTGNMTLTQLYDFDVNGLPQVA